MTDGFLGGRSFGPGFVVGRSEKEGDFQDVRIRTSAEGLNYIELARDARDTSPRRYVVDRLLLPDGSWSRVVEADSFSPGVPVERMTESHATVQFVAEPNAWGMEAEPCFGLPAGMESPWTEPFEMVGNELLIPLGSENGENRTIFVSGDAPVNIASVQDEEGANRRVSLFNGSYRATIGSQASGVEIRREPPPGSADAGNGSASYEPVSLLVKTDNPRSSNPPALSIGVIEGTAAQAYYEGGNVFLEPAKPPILYGAYVLPFDVQYVSDGLYEAVGRDGVYVVASNPVENRRAAGLVSIVFDPYPSRWVKRLMGRAYCSLRAPAYVPPLVEEEPERISVATVEVENDYPDIPREVYTPYANQTGVFNAWEAGGEAVVFRPSARPFDVLLPFDPDTGGRDLGGHPVMRGETGRISAARGESGEIAAARPPEGGVPVGFESSEKIAELDLREGSFYFKWRDSSEFSVLSHADMEVYYKRGYLYVDSRAKNAPQGGTPSGLARIGEPPRGEWTATKVDWGRGELLVNERPALTETRTWGEVLFVGETDETRTWAEVMGIEVEEGVRSPDLPLAVEDFADVPPEWETGRPVGGGEEIEVGSAPSPRTWGRVLFEPFDEPPTTDDG